MSFSLSSNSEQLTRKKTSFSLQAKNLFLTFPQTDTSKPDALSRLLAFFERKLLEVHVIIIAQELHADGNPHLHICIWMAEKLRIYSSDYFDFVCNKHGSYEAMRSPAGARKYLSKYDADLLIHGDLKILNSHSSKVSISDHVASKILSGSTPSEICVSDPGFFLRYGNQVKTMHEFVLQKTQREKVIPLNLPLLYSGDDPSTALLVKWLNTNLFVKRFLKQKQLFISGPPSSYKSFFFEYLANYLRVYFMPISEDWYNGYDDSFFDLVVMDEFLGQKMLTFLNSFSDGTTVTLKVKNNQVTKRNNLPFVIISNKTISEIYTKPEHWISVAALKTRFFELQLNSPLDVFNISINGVVIPRPSQIDPMDQ